MTTPHRSLLLRVATAVFGMALIVAAVLKMVSGSTATESPVTAIIPTWSVGLVPFAELALDIWLLSGWGRFGAWLVAVPTLAVFSLHSVLLTAGGQSSCGCLGRQVTLPPVVPLVFDVCLLGLMLRSRPAWQGWPTFGPVVQAVTVAGVLLAAVAGGAVARYGSVRVAVAAARGVPVALVSETVGIGSVPAGASVERSLLVVNLSDEPVQVALAESGCNCAEVGGLPATVEPGARVDLPVRVTVGTTTGDFRRKGRLRTTAGELDFEFVAWVVSAPGGPVEVTGCSLQKEQR